MNEGEIISWLKENVAEIVHANKDDIDIDAPLLSLCLDSLSLFTLTGDLANVLDREISSSLLWECQTIHEIARQLSRDEKRQSSAAATSNTLRGPVPMTFAQERIWRYRDKGDRDSNFSISCHHLHGPLDFDALTGSIDELARRHEILRTTLDERDGKPIQIVNPPREGCLEIHDVSGRQDREAILEEFCARAGSEAMDLKTGPLFDPWLIKLSPSHSLFIVRMHHTIYDAHSCALIYDELDVLYRAFGRGEPSPLPEPRWQMADFATWQQENFHRDSPEWKNQVDFWERHWSSDPAPRLELDLHWDGSPPEELPFERSIIKHWISDFDNLRGFACRNNLGFLSSMMSIYALAIAELTGRDHFHLGTYVAERPAPIASNLIGFFVNLVLLRIDLGGMCTLGELLGGVNRTVGEASKNQNLPFEEIQAALLHKGIVPELTSIFQTVPMLKTYLRLDGIETELVEIPHKSVAWGMMMTLSEQKEGMLLTATYDVSMYDPDKVEGFMDRISGLIQSADEACRREDAWNVPLSEILLADAAESIPELRCVNRLHAAGVLSHK